MQITVTLTEKEILDNPNDFDLGGLARNKYWQERRNQEGPPVDDEHFFLDIGEDGLVKSIIHPSKKNELDKCVICGKESPYTYNTHIDYRIGYIEGAGQGCFHPNVCEKI